MQQQHGFTLVELIIVIVILGILAVTAAPKLIDISSDAKKANYVALTAAIKSAAEMARMKCRVDADCDMNGNSQIDVEGNLINMFNGYPGSGNGGMGPGIVDAGGWVWQRSHLNIYYIYPGTGDHTTSDCIIVYGLSSGSTSSPTYNTHGNADDTCS